MAKISKRARQYLQYPDKLFRRVKGADGKLHLSKNAKAFHPGQGVYRSSYKNAMRLTRTETNAAYRLADQDRWQRMDFVVGMRVHKSNNHPTEDICDVLAGDYPKTFKFSAWHPQCRCYVTSILCTKEEMMQMQRDILAGKSTNGFRSVNEVRTVPKAFTDWVDANGDRIMRAKALPYFLKDNGKIVDGEWVLNTAIQSKATGSVATLSKNAVALNNFGGKAISAITEAVSATYKLSDDVAIPLYNFIHSQKGMFKGDVELNRKRMGKHGALAKTEAFLENNGKLKSYITISTSDIRVTIHGKKVIFNPYKELEGAIKAIKEGRGLTFLQEYSIENVWHEMLHTSSRWWMDKKKSLDSSYITPMECITQFCARMSYDRLLKNLGGKTKWSSEIKKHGLGYRKEVRNFYTLLDYCGITENYAYSYFEGKYRSYYYDNFRDAMIKLFAGSKKIPTSNIERLIGNLSMNVDEFAKELTGV